MSVGHVDDILDFTLNDFNNALNIMHTIKLKLVLIFLYTNECSMFFLLHHSNVFLRITYIYVYIILIVLRMEQKSFMY